MINEALLDGLHPLEIKLLLNTSQDETLTAESIVEKLKYNVGQANQAVSWLAQKELLAEKERRTVISYAITDLGHEYRDKGTPEKRILDEIQKGPIYLSELPSKTGLEQKDVGSSFGQMSKKGALYLTEDKKVFTKMTIEEIRPIFVDPKMELLEKLSTAESIPADDLNSAAQALAA